MWRSASESNAIFPTSSLASWPLLFAFFAAAFASSTKSLISSRFLNFHLGFEFAIDVVGLLPWTDGRRRRMWRRTTDGSSQRISVRRREWDLPVRISEGIHHAVLKILLRPGPRVRLCCLRTIRENIPPCSGVAPIAGDIGPRRRCSTVLLFSDILVAPLFFMVGRSSTAWRRVTISPLRPAVGGAPSGFYSSTGASCVFPRQSRV